MKLVSCLAAVIALCLGNAALADDDDLPIWRPNNAAANDITGPITVERKTLHVGNAVFTLRLDSDVPAFRPGQGSFAAHIYRVTRMANPTLLDGKTLCGDVPPTWIVIVPQPPAGLEVDAFAGAEKPVDASSPGLCNTFAYIR
jgi:hypothetical protein